MTWKAITTSAIKMTFVLKSQGTCLSFSCYFYYRAHLQSDFSYFSCVVLSVTPFDCSFVHHACLTCFFIPVFHFSFPFLCCLVLTFINRLIFIFSSFSFPHPSLYLVWVLGKYSNILYFHVPEVYSNNNILVIVVLYLLSLWCNLSSFFL